MPECICSLPVTCPPSSLRLAVGGDAPVLHQVTLVLRLQPPGPSPAQRYRVLWATHVGRVPILRTVATAECEPTPPGVARVTVGLLITQPTEWVKSLACQTHVLLREGESGPKCPLEDSPRGEGPDTRPGPALDPPVSFTESGQMQADSFTSEPGSLCPNGICPGTDTLVLR